MAYRFSYLLALAVFSGCSAMPSMDKAAPLDRQMGYVYGSFKLPRSDGACELRVGLAMKRSGAADEYVIEFSRDDSVLVFAVRPGRYEMAQVVFKTCEGIESGGRKEFRSVLIDGQFEVSAMSAVYLGNYEARTSASTAPSGLGTRVTQRWGVTAACRDFTRISNRLVEGWPKLNEVRRVDATSLGAPCVF